MKKIKKFEVKLTFDLVEHDNGEVYPVLFCSRELREDIEKLYGVTINEKHVSHD